MHDPNDLMPIAYRAASSVARSPILAQEASERALHLLTVAVLEGSPPQHPKAWLRTVARRSACALLRSDWARTQTMSPDWIAGRQAEWRQPRGVGTQLVRERVAPRLSPRQRDALEAALSCNSTRDAARCCGMPPRDFRRSLGAISRKARAILDGETLDDPFSDDPGVQFRLTI